MGMGALSTEALAWARGRQARSDATLADVLRAHDMVAEADLTEATARGHRAEIAPLARHPPDPRLIDALGPETVLAERVLPWRRAGGVTVVAMAEPGRFAALRPRLEAALGPVMLAVAGRDEMARALLALRRRALCRRAETRVAGPESCRTLIGAGPSRFWLAAFLALVAAALTWPGQVLTGLAVWAVLSLTLTVGLRSTAALAQLPHLRERPAYRTAFRHGPVIARLPVVTLLVPLLAERQIAARLIARLGEIDYPPELVDICLIVEEDDHITRGTLALVDLPRWMRRIDVPRGTVMTKPRALNFALDFARGSIVGVYDAEDAPAPDQIHRIVELFGQRGPETACLQGVLDFYNARQNWLSRCFTVDYATWFRVVLPGLARLGLVVPLGGTTLFFRRAALESLGGWDAHNVTEDADLGVRLARRGYRTELIPTVTEEEANARIWPWIRQRSRWLKGYAVTYGSHMRRPGRLLADLGPWRFLGVQIVFLGTLSQFALAPVLWAFWGLAFGLGHPFGPELPLAALVFLGGFFLTCELLTIALGCLAVATPRHRWLMLWVPTMILYYPLGAVAAFKAGIELLSRPFYWDKTAHDGAEDGVTPRLPAPAHPS